MIVLPDSPLFKVRTDRDDEGGLVYTSWPSGTRPAYLPPLRDVRTFACETCHAQPWQPCKDPATGLTPSVDYGWHAGRLYGNDLIDAVLLGVE